MPSKTKRRGYGSGAVYQRASDGMWCVSIELPDVGGKRRRKVIARKNQAAVISELRKTRSELDRAGNLPTSSPTLTQWLTIWLDTIAAPRLKPRTLTGYRQYVARYIVPTIGKHRLEKLTPDHVRKMHAFIIGGAGGKRPLSSTTALQAHRILVKALTDAMREGKVNRNVATLLDAPSKAVSTRGALTADDARTMLLSVADDLDQAAAWSVALLAGLRQGERLGMTADSVDLNAGTITVSWQLQRLAFSHGCAKVKGDGWPCGMVRGGSCPDRSLFIPPDQEARQVHGGLWLTRPKSRAGWREVPIAPLLGKVLTKYMDERPRGDEGLIFARADGHPVDPSDDTAAWDAALRAAGLPDVVLHSARHTTATLLYELGVPEHTREEILGHSSATTTAGYTHVSDPLTRDAMGRLGELLTPRAPQIGA